MLPRSDSMTHSFGWPHRPAGTPFGGSAFGLKGMITPRVLSSPPRVSVSSSTRSLRTPSEYHLQNIHPKANWEVRGSRANPTPGSSGVQLSKYAKMNPAVIVAVTAITTARGVQSRLRKRMDCLLSFLSSCSRSRGLNSEVNRVEAAALLRPNFACFELL